MLKPLAFVAVFFSCLACAQNGSSYEVDLRYSPKRHILPSRVTKKWEDQAKDSVVFFFESGFKDDSVTISVGSNKMVKKLTSDEVVQFAGFIPVTLIKNNELVSIQINSGRIVILTHMDGIKYIAVNIAGDKLRVEILDNFAYYD